MVAQTFAAAVAATATTKAAKSEIPTIEPTKTLKLKVDNFQFQKRLLKQTQETLDKLSMDIVKLVSYEQDRAGFTNDYHGSYEVLGNKKKVSVIFADKYSIKSEDEGKIAVLLGPNYNKLFTTKTTIKLKDEVINNPALQERLMKYIGSSFAAFFESQITICPVEGFKSLIYQYVTPKKLEKLRLLVKQAKPSLK